MCAVIHFIITLILFSIAIEKRKMITFTLIFIILNYARTENVNYISGQEYHPSCTE